MRGLKMGAAPTAALLLLCLLWASASLRADLLPGSAPPAEGAPMLGQAALLGLFAVVAAGAALARKAAWPRGTVLVLAALSGMGLFVAPALLIALARGSIEESTRVALFSLAPVFAVVFEPHLGAASPMQVRGGMASGLIAVAGTLFVFPLDLPQTTAAALAFGGIVVAVAALAAANCVAARIFTDPAAPSALGLAAVATGSAAIVLGGVGMFTEHLVHPMALFNPWAALDLIALALLFWLMRKMTAVRMTTRFLIAPLIANLIGLAFLRPGVQWRGWLGLSLIALASGWLLLAPADEPEQKSAPLGIHPSL